MLHFRTLTVAFLAAIVMLQSSLVSAFDGLLSVENQTGYEIHYLYIRHADSPDWGDDRLGKAILDDGEKIKVTLEDYPSSIFDVKAEDEDGDEYPIFGIDIEVDDLVLTFDDLDNNASAGNGNGDNFSGYIEVTNSTDQDIYYLYVSHEDANERGDDVLGDKALRRGDSFRVDLDGYASSIFDVEAEGEKGDIFVSLAIDVESEDLTLTRAHTNKPPTVGGVGRYIEVFNVSGYDMHSLYVRHEDTDDWGDELLGNDSLESGESFKVDLDGYSSSIFDVKTIDTDQDVYIALDIDVETDDLSLTTNYIDSNASSTDGFSGYIEVTNSTGYDIEHLYIVHEDTDGWEEDVLGSDTLDQRDSFRFDVNGYSSSIFNVQAEDINGKVYTQLDIDIESDDLTLTRAHTDKEPIVDGIGRHIEIFNVSGYEMHSLYVSHEDVDGWGEELLGDDSLEDGESFRVDLEGYSSSIFNVKTIDIDQDVYQVFGIDVDFEDLNLTLDQINNGPSEGDYSGYLNITNTTGYDIEYLYVSHENSEDWGDDVLGNETLYNTDSFRVAIEGYYSSIVDIRAVDEDGDDYTLFSFDVEDEDLILTFDHYGDGSSSSGDFSGYISVSNYTNQDVHCLFIKHENADDWGDNLIEGAILEAGDSHREDLDGYPSSIFDVRAEGERGAVYTVYGIDIEVDDLDLDRDHLTRDESRSASDIQVSANAAAPLCETPREEGRGRGRGK